jgi:hypothetical protein
MAPASPVLSVCEPGDASEVVCGSESRLQLLSLGEFA